MKRLVAAGLAGLFAAAPPAWGSEPAGFYTDRPLDFSLRLGRHELDLDTPSGAVDTTVDRIGVAWRERFEEALQLGFYLDYAALRQANAALTAGRELTGYHAGLSLDLELLRAGPAALFLQATLGYQRVDDDDDTQRIVISWLEPGARLGASVSLAAGVTAYGGVRYGAIDGEERLSGAVNLTRSIEESDRTGGFGGLELDLGDGGYAGVAAQAGIDRSVRIYFGRGF